MLLGCYGSIGVDVACIRRRGLLSLNMFVFFSVRIIAHKIVNFKHFDNGILVCILISSVLLACEDVVNEKATINKVKKAFFC